MRVAVRPACGLIVWCVCCISATQAQVTRIRIPAGSPEDVAAEQISKEPDVNRRIEEWKDFVQKFAGSSDAATFGNWQLAQTLAASNHLAEALTYGDKALALQPHNLDILASQADAALKLKESSRVFDYARRGGESFNGIGQGSRPAGITDQDYQQQNAEQRIENQPILEYLEAVAYNVIAAEPDAKKRLSFIQRFNVAFPDSKFQEQISEFSVLTLENLHDTSTAIAYGEAVLAQNPKDLPTLTMMARIYIEGAGNANLEKGIAYAQRAIEVAKADEPGADQYKKTSAGFAYAALGDAFMKQEKINAAVPELKHGAALLSHNAAAAAPVFYQLGRAYVLLRRYEEATQVLHQAAGVAGPAQQPARDLLARIPSFRP